MILKYKPREEFRWKKIHLVPATGQRLLAVKAPLPLQPTSFSDVLTHGLFLEDWGKTNLFANTFANNY